MLLWGCDGNVTIDGTVYEATFVTALDSGTVFIGNRTLSNPGYRGVPGVKIYVSTGTLTNEQIAKIVNDSSASDHITQSDGSYHFDETWYSGKETLTILFIKKGYQPLKGTFYKNNASIKESICAVISGISLIDVVP
jgi:hypothetical protein